MLSDLFVYIEELKARLSDAPQQGLFQKVAGCIYTNIVAAMNGTIVQGGRFSFPYQQDPLHFNFQDLFKNLNSKTMS